MHTCVHTNTREIRKQHERGPSHRNKCDQMDMFAMFAASKSYFSSTIISIYQSYASFPCHKYLSSVYIVLGLRRKAAVVVKDTTHMTPMTGKISHLFDQSSKWTAFLFLHQTFALKERFDFSGS